MLKYYLKSIKRLKSVLQIDICQFSCIFSKHIAYFNRDKVSGRILRSDAKYLLGKRLTISEFVIFK
jgi:hypothetical protein